MNPLITPKATGLQNRAFSISGGTGLNRFNTEKLIKPMPGVKKSDNALMNPLLAYSLNHKSNQLPAEQALKEEIKNPFETGTSNSINTET
jgi:hypothetical protein